MKIRCNNFIDNLSYSTPNLPTMLRQLFLFLVIAFTFSSCYYPAQVVIHNKSGEDAAISSVYPADRIVTADSLTGYDHTETAGAISTRDYFRYGVTIPLINHDTIKRNYSFALKKQHEVIVETSWPVSSLSWGQTFIVNQKDTIVLKRKAGAFKKRGGRWTYTIQ